MAKVTLVRVKRKRNEESVDAFWLEQSHPKRHLKELSLSEEAQSTGTAKLLFRRIDTLQAADIDNVSVSKSLLGRLTPSESKEKRQREYKKQIRDVTSVEEHRKNSRAARYKQVWQRRNEEDPMQNAFHLYDVVREEEGGADERKEQEMLKKFMPLLQECAPDVFNRMNNQEEFVYDVYAEETQMDEEYGDDVTDDLLGTVRVSDMYSGYGLDTERDSDYDSEDSNREDHPDNDYPDEEDEEESDEEDEEESDEEESDEEDDDEEDEEDDDDDNESKKWQMRR